MSVYIGTATLTCKLESEFAPAQSEKRVLVQCFVCLLRVLACRKASKFTATNLRPKVGAVEQSVVRTKYFMGVNNCKILSDGITYWYCDAEGFAVKYNRVTLWLSLIHI